MTVGMEIPSLPLSLKDSPYTPIPVRLFPMRTLTAFLCLTFAVLLFSAGEAWSLPKCPGSYDQNTWHNCFGIGTTASGNKYVGEFRDDKQHGQGTYTFASGSKYLGEFRDGLPNGQGTYTSADGRVKEGIWENGELKQ